MTGGQKEDNLARHCSHPCILLPGWRGDCWDQVSPRTNSSLLYSHKDTSHVKSMNKSQNVTKMRKNNLSRNLKISLYPPSKFCVNLFIRFFIIPTNKPTNGHGWKQNLAGGGNKHPSNSDQNNQLKFYYWIIFRKSGQPKAFCLEHLKRKPAARSRNVVLTGMTTGGELVRH